MNPSPHSLVRDPLSARLLVAAAILPLVLGITGCAYFNTFYNAREHFKKAERSQTLNDDESGPTATAIREYELAIEKCNKVIQQHEGSRWVDDAILLMGRAYYGKHEYVQALDKFRALVNGFPDSDLRHEALFMTGLAYFRLNRQEEGRQTFDQLLRERPRFERRDEMLRIEAEALERGGDLDGAIATYRRIVTDFPDSDQRVVTLFDVGELYMRTAAFDSAYAAYDEALRIASRIDDRLEARRRRANALFREKRYEEALNTYRTVLDVGSNLQRDEREAIELRIAACLRELGEHERAITEYRRIAEASVGSVAAAEAVFNVGLIQELDYGDFAAAVEEYDSIARLQGGGARSVYATQAQARSRQLRGLIELGITTREAQSSDGAAAGALRLAEHFLFQEDDTTAALDQYALIEQRFPTAPEAAKAAYATAFVLDRMHADPDSTIARYLRVLEAYPGTTQAIGAGDYLASRGLEALIPEGALEPIVPDSTGTPADSTLVPEDVPGELGVVSAAIDTVAADTLSVPEHESRVPEDREAREDLEDREGVRVAPGAAVNVRGPAPSSRDSTASPDSTASDRPLGED